MLCWYSSMCYKVMCTVVFSKASHYHLYMMINPALTFLDFKYCLSIIGFPYKALS